jgi:hypothetical protein
MKLLGILPLKPMIISCGVLRGFDVVGGAKIGRISKIVNAAVR